MGCGKAKTTIPWRLWTAHAGAQKWRRSTRAHTSHTARTAEIILQTHGRQRIVIVMRRTTSVNGRLIHILGQESLEALNGRKLLDDVALETAAGAVAYRNKPVGAETQLQAIHRLVGQTHQAGRLWQHAERQHGHLRAL